MIGLQGSRLWDHPEKQRKKHLFSHLSLHLQFQVSNRVIYHPIIQHGGQ